MRVLLRRFTAWVQAALGLAVATAVGFYVNLATSHISARKHNSPLAILGDLGPWNVLPIVALILLIVQLRTASAEETAFRRGKANLVSGILAAASRSLVYPHRERQIRAIVTICDDKRCVRRTTYSYNTTSDPERTATFPIDFGITGRAWKTRSAVSEELAPDHISTYPSGVQPLIYKDLRCVLAVPLYNPRQPDGPLLGVLAFDSSEAISKVRFDTREAKEIAQAWADLISEVLTT